MGVFYLCFFRVVRNKAAGMLIYIHPYPQTN